MKEILKDLLKIRAIEFEPYQKRKRTLKVVKSYPERAYSDAELAVSIVCGLKDLVQEMCDECGVDNAVIVSSSPKSAGWGFGVATSYLRMPFACTERSQVTGRLEFYGCPLDSRDRVIVVTDFVGNGYTVLNVVDEVRATGAIVIGVVSIIASGMPGMARNFEAAHTPFKYITDYDELQKVAEEEGLL